MNLRQHWREAQAGSDALWQVVRPEAMLDRPVPERHRLIFYLGHLEAFDWNLLAPELGLHSFRAEWDKLFAFGIDPVDGKLPDDAASAWPPVEEVLTYNREVRRKLGAAPGGADVRWQVAIEHRWMHIETLSYLLHNLPFNRKQPGPAPTVGQAGVPHTAAVEIPAGEVTLGLRRGGEFGWDNEYDAHQTSVAGFAADRYKVTNGDYLRFVRAGAMPPHFWTQHQNAWFYRGMFGETPLPLDQPVYVTHSEASAYCSWKGTRLPTEAEWGHMASGAAWKPRWGWDPIATNARSTSASAYGVEDLVGNGWEWTATAFAPFPGFVPFSFYPGYSANFFDGQHFVMKGGSGRTAARLLRPSFRNWFQPNYPYAYAGFRCVE